MNILRSVLFSAILTIAILSNPAAQTNDESWKVFDDLQVGRIDITAAPSALDYLYRNTSSDSEFVASVRFRNRFIDHSEDSVGFRLRGNTSRQSAKKSFKISFNTFKKGNKFFGLEKLNLNGEHNDPSIIRSKLSLEKFSQAGMHSCRSSHIQVYINGKYYGLYISVEHIDEEFLKRHFADDGGNMWKCMYGADLTYKGDNPNLYKTASYELSTNETANDYSQLARLIKVLNKTPQALLPDSLERILDVPETVKFLAMSILLGHWDSYWTNNNNYYLYQEPGSGIFHIFPYDCDNTFGIEWGNTNWTSVNPYTPPTLGAGTRPLAEKILANNQFRDLYTHFLEYFKNNIFSLPLWEGHIDSLRDKITQPAIADNYRTLDYGYTVNDFLNSYSAAGFSKAHVKFGLKQYINLRNSNIASQLKYVNAPPVAYKIDHFPKNPKPGDSVYVYVSIFSKPGLSTMSVNFTRAGTAESVSYPLKFSPAAGSKAIEDTDRYCAVLPPLGNGGSGSFNISLKDVKGQSTIYPLNGPVGIKGQGSSGNSIVISELLADNSSVITDPAGNFDDYTELYNPTPSPILLSGKYLTDNPGNLKKWRFQKDSLYIAPGEYLLVWLDEQQSQPGLHANFKLSKSGEYLAITDTDGVTILDSVSFGAQTTNIAYGRYPLAIGEWQFMPPTPGYKNMTTGVKEVYLPLEYSLSAYPNPFNPATTVQFELPEMDHVSIKLYDGLGREVMTLFSGEQNAGIHKLNLPGNNLSSGIYFCRLASGKFTKTIKLQLLK